MSNRNLGKLQDLKKISIPGSTSDLLSNKSQPRSPITQRAAKTKLRIDPEPGSYLANALKKRNQSPTKDNRNTSPFTRISARPGTSISPSKSDRVRSPIRSVTHKQTTNNVFNFEEFSEQEIANIFPSKDELDKLYNDVSKTNESLRALIAKKSDSETLIDEATYKYLVYYSCLLLEK